MVFLINLLIILGPKSLPKNYDVDFAKDLEDDPGKIYKLKVSLNSEGELIYNDLTKSEIGIIKKKNIPILVFGPMQNQNKNNSYIYRYHFFIKLSSSNLFIIIMIIRFNSVDDDKDINGLFTNLQIGFYE
jgi:hypothetical protein